MAHTPGPWQVSGIRERMAGEQWLTVGPDNYKIAYVIYSDKTPADHVQSHADARLIAAAPDMLAALEDIAITDEADWMRERARTAIAKATGEQKPDEKAR